MFYLRKEKEEALDFSKEVMLKYKTSAQGFCQGGVRIGVHVCRFTLEKIVNMCTLSLKYKNGDDFSGAFSYSFSREKGFVDSVHI